MIFFLCVCVNNFYAVLDLSGMENKKQMAKILTKVVSFQKLSGHLESQCEEALLKAIYRVDELTEDLMTCNVQTHTNAAGKGKKVRW